MRQIWRIIINIETVESVESVENKLRLIRAEIVPLTERVYTLNRKLDKIKSLNNIDELGITKNMGHDSSDKALPYFGIYSQYCEWFKENSNLNYDSWNNLIISRKNIINNILPNNITSRYEDLE